MTAHVQDRGLEARRALVRNMLKDCLQYCLQDQGNTKTRISSSLNVSEQNHVLPLGASAEPGNFSLYQHASDGDRPLEGKMQVSGGADAKFAKKTFINFGNVKPVAINQTFF